MSYLETWCHLVAIDLHYTFQRNGSPTISPYWLLNENKKKYKELVLCHLSCISSRSMGDFFELFCRSQQFMFVWSVIPFFLRWTRMEDGHKVLQAPSWDANNCDLGKQITEVRWPDYNVLYEYFFFWRSISEGDLFNCGNISMWCYSLQRHLLAVYSQICSTVMET